MTLSIARLAVTGLSDERLDEIGGDPYRKIDICRILLGKALSFLSPLSKA
jgi:hypothetical protein